MIRLHSARPALGFLTLALAESGMEATSVELEAVLDDLREAAVEASPQLTAVIAPLRDVGGDIVLVEGLTGLCDLLLRIVVAGSRETTTTSSTLARLGHLLAAAEMAGD